MNWRKSKTQSYSKGFNATTTGAPHSLLDLSAKIVAEHIPFQSIEQKYEHIPEPVQRRIIFWSFPRHEDDIKMYSSLSSDTFNVNGPSTTTSSSSATSISISSNINNTIQSPSSSAAFAWADQPNVQNNSNQASNHTSPNLRNNSKQLTFHKGLRLYNEGCVQDVLQVGFNLSGLVVVRTNPTNTTSSGNSKVRNNNNHTNHNNHAQHNPNNNDVIANQASVSGPHDSGGSNINDVAGIKNFRVSVTFDRCKITSVACSCELKDIFWCEHVVALILYRIRNPETIDLRVPISETLLSLDRQQLQKLVQYIIAEHHTDVLPTAQRLLDEMRQSFSEINQIQGAPDPTAGACVDDQHIWHLDENQVNEKVQNYLNLVCSNSKDACKQINALFEKIREMFRAKDSNGTRLLKLITEQFLVYATRNEKSRPLWDQLVSFWVVVMLNPDLSKSDKIQFVQLLGGWSRVPKCPKEDMERRVTIKRKAAELSDDEDTDDFLPNPYTGDYPPSFNQSNNYPAHMATHRRSFNNNLPVLRPYNQLPILPSSCSCQAPHSMAKKMRTNDQQSNDSSAVASRPYRPSTSSANQPATSRASSQAPNTNENRPVGPQEPRSVFSRALDFQDASWDDPHLQLILNKDGPVDIASIKSHFVDFAGNPLWHESVSQAAARVETLRCHGYKEQALRLTVATVRRLKLHQDQWCLSVSSEASSKASTFNDGLDIFAEGWVGHPFDPINVMLDILLDASLTEINNNGTNGVSNGPINGNVNSGNLCGITNTRCSCPYNQALVDFTHRILPDLANFSYTNRVDGYPILPLVGLTSRRAPVATNQASADKTPYFHVPVPGCCQKDSYLTLGVELALIALGQQRSIPTIATAHERSVRQEAELISKLETIDTSDPLLIDILKHQTTLLLEGGPFQSSCCGVPTDSSPLHTFARYLFDSLVAHYPQLAYKIGVYALKVPLVSDENGENLGAARTSPRSINYNHLQSEQLALAQTMLSRAKDDNQQGGHLRKVYRASVKNIRNPTSLLKLSKHVLKEAKPNGATLYPSLLKTAFELGLQVLKLTLSPHSSNSKARREAILFIVECATDMGLESVLQVMKDARDHFSPIEALYLVVPKDNDHVNIKSQALSKLKLKEVPLREEELNRRSRELALECASRDPALCALEALKFCEIDEESLKKALKIVIEAGASGAMDVFQLIKVADHISDRGLTDSAFDIAMVAVDSLSIPSNSDNSNLKISIFKSCDYAKKVNGFSTLIPKLINNIECATVLSEIYHRYSPTIMTQYDLIAYGGYNNDLLNTLNPEIYKQKLEDARWWDALLRRTMRAFVDTTRTRLQNISPRHYGEFIDFLVKAQGTFEKASDGPQQFKDLIAEIIKSYRTKKKLMERLKERFDPTYISSKLQSSVA